MNGRPDEVDLFHGKTDPSGGLEWMMQSQQVSDEMLTQVLFGEYYAEAYRLASFLVSDDQTAQAICEQSN
jgi:hypothetical protein